MRSLRGVWISETVCYTWIFQEEELLVAVIKSGDNVFESSGFRGTCEADRWIRAQDWAD
jgi:hypothetical protein